MAIAKRKETFESLIEELEKHKRKRSVVKHIDSRNKGNRGESGLCKIFEKHFGGKFMRTPRSGGLVGGKNFDAKIHTEALEVLSADIITPKEFAFSIEHKNYNEEGLSVRDLLHNQDVRKFYDWWGKTKEDALKSGKRPMLVIKLGRQDRFCCINGNYDELYKIFSMCDKSIIWKNMDEIVLFVNLNDLLELCDEFFWGMPALNKNVK